MRKRKLDKHAQYLRFLSLCHALDQRLIHQVDQFAIRLLEEIVLAEYERQPLTVSRCMSKEDMASPATIHRRIQALVKAGLVELRFLAGNRRTKYLFITNAAHQYFAKRSELMVSSMHTVSAKFVSERQMRETVTNLNTGAV